MLSYIRHTNRIAADADSTQSSIAYAYSLSKRTTLFASYALLDNERNASLKTAGIKGSVYKLFQAGINHSF